MDRTRIIALAAIFGCTLVTLTTRATSQGATHFGSIMLQGVTPGFSQSGNANISGRFLSSEVFATNPSAATGSSAVTGFSTATATGGNVYAIQGVTSSPNSTAIIGQAASSAAGFAIGVRGRSSTASGYGGYFDTTGQTSTAVYGFASAGIGANFGGLFQTNSSAGVGLRGEALNTTGTTFGVHGRSFSASGTGVVGESAVGSGVRGHATGTTGTTYGGYFLNFSTSGYAVYGLAAAVSGTTYGVYGRSASPAGFGVYGTATATTGSGIGVYGSSTSPTGTALYGTSSGTGGAYGVQGIGTGAGSTGVYGQGLANGVFATGGSYGLYATTTSGTGVYGRTNSTSSAGVSGTSFSTSSTATGVRGEVTADGGAGVRGSNFASGNGVVGFSAAPSFGNGVFGSTTGDGNGVAGDSGSVAGAVGVIGYQSGPNDAMFAFGDFSCTGNKAFRIDHPLDPENKDLNHFCTEGPEPLNVYSGNARTDAKGYATITLPDYFESINKDFRYQLTVLDEGDSNDFVMVKVVRKIQDNTFAIRSSSPNIEVSWRVEATRNDPYVRANPPKVEVVKIPSRRGKMYYPQFYGKGEESAIYPKSRRIVGVVPKSDEKAGFNAKN